ncbi:hypothetical protein LJB71_14980 [Thermomonas sp. S9]|uniref:hypothetical protein n=1 Tax=Thermomonas sp. S9 TaxID=2885203 RepID=UPI00216B451F|nr:hypothetical protein [Thermomonas sp. S9]MCR6497386.1 hypothetical protein [Thermomonas sp. S9]
MRRPLARSSATMLFTAQTLASRTMSSVVRGRPSASSRATRCSRSLAAIRAACMAHSSGGSGTGIQCVTRPLISSSPPL